MAHNPDWIELLREFNAAGVRYLVVGAHAVMLYARPRGTSDFDVWIAHDEANASRVYRALASFGAPMERVSVGDFASDDLIFQIGVPPGRIDVITAIEGVEFEDAWARRVVDSYGGVAAPFISRPDLLCNKRAVGRLRDLADVEMLEREARKR